MKIPAARFSKSVFAALSEQERDARLRELETLLNPRFVGCDALSQFQERRYVMIDELEALGFSLGPWDYSCEVEIWGGPSYIDKHLEDDLLLRSSFPAGIALAWKDFERLPKDA
jgi:hypothetical protein